MEIRGGECIIGSNCLFSRNITIGNDDGHGIYDVKTGELISDIKNPKLVIGNHVWLAEDVSVFGEAYIGDGCMVGAKSFVKGKFPNNCMIAGVKAKILRRDIAWNTSKAKNGIMAIPEKYRRLTDDNME